MKSVQKIILIKVLVILSIAFAIFNVSQLHINNNNKINLKRRDTKFFIQEEKTVSFNNKNEIETISIDTNENNKNNFIDQLNSEDSHEIKSSEDLIINNESSEVPSIETVTPTQNESEIIIEEVVAPKSYDNMNLDVDTNVEFIQGEAPKYSERYLDC